MKVDKKQLPQLIILGVLVVICVGYLSFSVLSPKNAGHKPAPAKATAPNAAAAAEEQGGETLVPVGIFPDLTAAAARRDPFTPQIGDSSKTPVKIATTNLPKTRVSSLTNELSPVNPFKNSAGGTGSQLLPVEEKDPEFVITGVIRGAENVAIIRVGEGGRHVVKQGQLIDGRYKVLRVSDDGAVLAYKNRRIHLKLGGVKNAS